MPDDPNSEDNVIRRMLEAKPKPREKPPESSEPRRRGRPVGGGGARKNR